MGLKIPKQKLFKSPCLLDIEDPWKKILKDPHLLVGISLEKNFKNPIK